MAQLAHSSWISSVAFSPDGRQILTGSEDGTARLWEAATGRELRRFRHSVGISSVAFSPDGRQIMTGSRDRTARLWEAATGKELRRFRHSVGVSSVAFSPDGRQIMTGSWDGTARLWEAATGKEIRRFRGHSDSVDSVAFSANGRQILTGSKDATARLWDVDTGNELRRFKGHSRWVNSVAFSPDGRQILSGSREAARLWEAATGKELRLFHHSAAVRSVAFSPDGRQILTGSGGAARLWEAATGKELRLFQYQGPSKRLYGIRTVAFSPDGRKILTGSWDNTVRLWETNTGRELRHLGHSAAVRSVAFSPDGRQILTGSGDGAARLWEAATGKEIRRFRGHSDSVNTVTFSPDGRQILTGSEDASARLWDVNTGNELRCFRGHSAGISSVAFSPDGRQILTGSRYAARLWEAATGRELRGFHHSAGANSVAFSPDGRQILTGSGDGAARLWEAATGKELRRFGHSGHYGDSAWVNSVAFSLDGRQILTGSRDHTARLWEAATGKELRRFEVQPRAVFSVAFSPDGRQILTGSGDATTRLWDVKTGNELRCFRGHSAGISSVAFSPDGRQILTGSGDATTRLWDVATGHELCRMISFSDGSWAVVDAAGRFDAANGGDVQGLHWVINWGFGPEAIALNQLKERYYEPGLLAKYLGFNLEPMRKVEAFKNPLSYPSLELDPIDPADAQLTIRLTNRGGGIGRVEVSVNGKEVAADARGPALDPAAEAAELAVDLGGHPFLIPGEDHVIKVRAFNAEGYLASRGVVQRYHPPGEPPFKLPTLWAIVAGVSDYTGDRIDLRYAAKDARDMANALKLGASRLFGAEHVRLSLLASDDPAALPPTKANLGKAFAEAKAVKRWDILVVYLAGHGVALGDDYYYLTQEARSTDLTDPAIRAQAAVSSEEMVRWIKQSPALKQVMVLDTCAAGTAARRLVEKRTISSDQIRAIERLKDRTGFHVLMGSAADAVSYEATQYAQGLLTYALLQGMKGAALREEEFIDVSRLFQHAADTVPQLATHIGGIQRPRIAAPKGTSFDIGQLTVTDRQAIPLAMPKPMLLNPMLQNPEELFDNLELTIRLRKRLRDASYTSAHGEPSRLAVVYVNADELHGAIRLSGIYAVEGDRVKARVVLVKDGEKLETLQVEGSKDNPEGLTDGIVEKLAEVLEKLGNRVIDAD